MTSNIHNKWLDLFHGEIPPIPPISYLMKLARDAKERKKENEAENYERLIYLLHNSVVSPYSDIDLSVKFGYGGIGVVIHKNCIIKKGVSIGQNVTLGGSPGIADKYNGKSIHVPVIEDNVYIAAGSKLVGGLIIGRFSIIGANSVVNKTVPPFTLVGGQPAKPLKKITKNNCLRYRSFYSSLKNLNEVDFIKNFPDG